MKQISAKVISNEQILPGFTHPLGRNTLSSQVIWLSCPDVAREAKPGQFIMVRCGEECVLPRPFSIHQVNNDSIALFFTVWEGGKGTSWLSQREPEDNVDIFGPLGNGYTIYPDSKNLLLIAGGIGIAPLRFLSDKAIEQGKKVNLLMGASSAVQLLPTESSNQGLLTDGILPWGITIHKSTDDGSDGYKGLVTELLTEQQHIGWADQVFACGPVPMYKAMAQMPELKDRPVQVSLEVVMGCGRGVCYGCTVKTKGGLKKICKDGPVFNLDDILWD